MGTNKIEEIKNFEEIINDLNNQIWTYHAYCGELNGLAFQFKEDLKSRLNKFENNLKTILENGVGEEDVKGEILDFIRSLKKRIDGFEEDCCYEEENYKKLGILDENEILKKQVKQMKVIIGGYKKILYKETKQ